ncbi:FtsB family cell division protein [Nocardia bovistercoris]|uniref:Septum formation initiator family protein n=1 Tax=Nocardia bovistercoris TaxID=2785916 RepID=A0A931IA04_9NOCA|nr:septum formation initiator family protein [Nocardia bovistercoris]MBH0776058.1 septum formation initiator family protein [Nocardia bovistercoris]
MTERRARGAGPTGRGERRTTRFAGSRPRAGADTETAARPAAAKRAARRRGEGDRVAAPRKIPARRSGDRYDKTILGLSTGKAVILAVVVCALALTLAVPMRTYFAQRAEAAELAQQRRELESDVARLRDRRAQQQDPAFIRAEARDRLRLVMPGETPYIVQVPGIEAPPRPAAPTQSKPPDPWYTELWETISQPQPTAQAEPTPAPAREGPR